MVRRNRLSYIAVIAVLTLVAVGCDQDWAQFGGTGTQTGANDSNTTITVANAGSLHQLWAIDATSPTAALLAQSGKLIYSAGSGTTPVLALDTTTGSTTWSRPIDTSWSSCGTPTFEDDVPTAPAVAKGALYAYRDQHGNRSCGLGASYNLFLGTETLDAATGATTSSDVTQSCNICGDNPVVTITDSDPVVGPDGTVYRVVVTYNGLIGVNLAKPVHTHETLTGGSLAFTGADSAGNGPDLSTPAVTATAAYLTETDGHLVSVKLADGSLNWSAGIPTSSGIRSTPSTDGTSVFVTVGTKLLAFDATTGTPKWTATLPDVGTGSAPATDHGRVFVRTATALVAVDSATGVTQWSAPLAAGPAPLAPAGPRVLPSSAIPAVQLGSPSIANGVVFVGTQGGQLDAFDAAGSTGCTGTPVTCTPLLSAPLGGPTDGSRPIIFGGSVAISARTATASRVLRFVL